MLLVLSIDGLPAGMLGCYGNDWVGTPAIDRFAAESLLFDMAITDCPSPAAVRSFLSGTSSVARRRHAADDQTGGESKTSTSLPGILAQSGWRTSLITDDTAILELPDANAFEEALLVEPDLATMDKATAQDLGQTRLAKFFAAAVEALESELANSHGSPQSACWLHTTSLTTVWDAPQEYRRRYQDEDDPETPDIVTPPHRSTAKDETINPDELLGLRRAFAGQVAALDDLLDSFLEYLTSSSEFDEAHILLTSPRGFPLGQHGIIGWPESEFVPFEESVHIPLLWRFPDRRHAAEHWPGLFQPADLAPTILAFLDSLGGHAQERAAMSEHPDGVSHAAAIEELADSPRELATVVPEKQDAEEYAIRAPAWNLIERHVDGETSHELFAKPDDRWEMNNVADLCPEIVTLLKEQANAQLSKEAQPCAIAPALDERLTSAH